MKEILNARFILQRYDFSFVVQKKLHKSLEFVQFRFVPFGKKQNPHNMPKHCEGFNLNATYDRITSIDLNYPFSDAIF